MSVLKFSQMVHELRPGDNLIARINDPDVVVNLEQFLSSQPDLHFGMSRTDADYCIRVTKR